MRFRKPTYTVQLHRVVADEPFEDNPRRAWRIAHSWQPMTVRGLREARDAAHRLRKDNQWAGPNSGPHVTITGPKGESVPEWEARI